MTDITKLSVQLYTASDAGAGTDGFVYIGIAGREFHVDASRNDFEAGDQFTYIFGDGANVLDDARNDPRLPRLDTDDADRYPVYVRFSGKDNDDDWCLEGVTVTVNPGGSGTRTYDNPRLVGTGNDQKIWLGKRFGNTVQLRRV
ncbi:hypothetical protein GCM10022384_06830 [Streptomyces marokkonensis]|uniref:PLAT domain-containing protein n=1 Tax=Streptomyces marokkonensis TaxID=324855 RepID=A0ABP7NXS3_9ACTN